MSNRTGMLTRSQMKSNKNDAIMGGDDLAALNLNEAAEESFSEREMRNAGRIDASSLADPAIGS